MLAGLFFSYGTWTWTWGQWTWTWTWTWLLLDLLQVCDTDFRAI